MAASESPRALIVWAVAAVVAALALVWALYLVRQVIVLIYVSVLLAIGFSPLVRLIERQTVLPIGTRIPRWLAILIVYLGILAVVTAIGFVVLPPLIEQARELASYVPTAADRAQRFLVAHGVISERKSVGEIVGKAPAPTDVVGTVVLTFWGLIGGMLGLVSIVILTFYLLVDAEGVFAALVRLFPRQRRIRVRAVSHQIGMKVSAWLIGQLMLAAIIGVTSVLWLGLLGIPYFYVLALIAAVGEMIPILGPLLAAIPGIAIALGISWKLAIVATVLYVAQQQLEANLLVPKLMERQLGLTPVAVIIALLMGGALLGIPGAILAIPTAAILQVLFQELVGEEG